jgi:hypothetical protein
MSDKNALVPLGISPGSRPLKHTKWERYARYRAQALPRIVAFRKIGNYAANDKTAHNNASRLENKPGVKARIDYLTKQAEERIIEKRARIEERLWAIHEANIQDFFVTEDDLNPTETSSNPAEIANNPDQQKVAVSPRARVVPRPLTGLDPETAKLIEDVTVDSRGRLVPKLYSKLAANKELRAMLNISAKEAPRDVTQLSDAELIQTLAQQAKELGIHIDLNYTFHKPKNKPDK